MINLDFAIIDTLNSLVFNKKEFYKVDGIYPDNKNSLHIKVCRGAHKLNITCVSLLEKESEETIAIVAALDDTQNLWWHQGIKIEKHYLFATMINIEKPIVSVDEFKRNIEIICIEHIKARQMLLSSGCELLWD